MRRLTPLSLCLICAAFAFGTQAHAAGPRTAAPPAAEQQQQIAPVNDEAMAILNRMADYLAQAPRFSVTIRASYDVVQASGEKIEFGEHRAVTLSRPGSLRSKMRGSDGQERLVIYDGTGLTVFDGGENVYGRVEKAGTVDEAVRYLVQDLQVRLPLALLLVSTLPAELGERIQALDHVEQYMLAEAPSDHLAGRTEAVDFQIWIAKGDQPVPHRVVITYKRAEGAPQYRADFSEWNMSPDVSPALFAFDPPDGAEQVPVLVRVQRAVEDKPQAVRSNPEARGDAGGKAR